MSFASASRLVFLTNKGDKEPQNNEDTMALEKIKTEMKGTGGGRWCTREVAKKSSKKIRRHNDKRAAREAANG
ncbi:MAG: hypothetical protein A2289_23840 [Deltaproteobacteria bacterium RIFOXYA12_FULL_58_15]|nr:MAG: hypothetical protein A2289_23840 [Deltaproteobacteria bacterium RIFOXYA12_FULL_58_15]